ncbi:hypothetical protein [Paenirhodobacter populi]|uniref:hypothetical protein n=1 Tax=Paenirhodobacter populi TaxID=2306993 RepID=UPI0026998155
MRRWENPRKKAIANFIKVKGDMEVGAIVTADLVDFRNWWLEKMEEDDLTPNSANKDFIHLTSTLKHVARVEDMELRFRTDGLAIPDDHKEHRRPFPVEWIRDSLLAPGALDGLNPEARGSFSAW